MRRATGVLLTVLALAAIGVGGWWAIDRFAEDEDAAVPEDEVELVAVPVVRTDLLDRETLDGTLRYGSPGVVAAQAPGTITALPEVGDRIALGDVAFEIDGLPVIVMLGERPAWRSMGEGVTDGADIRQLEANLVLLGYFDEDLTVDEEFTSLTADLVSDWQADLGLEDTGMVDLGRVVFLDQGVRVAELLVGVGSVVGPGTPVLATSSTRQEVQLWLDADRQDLLDVGDAVGLELPDETETAGIVSAIGDVVTTIGTGPEARRVLEVTIRLDEPSVAAGFDEAPVDVEVISQEARDVLAVPVNALLALAEGGYAVEVRRDDGSAGVVAVDIGEFADGLVAVTGDLAEGDLVLVPG